MAISSSKPEGSARKRYCPTINRPRMRFPRRSAADRSCMIVLKWSFSVPQLPWSYSEQTKTHSRNLSFALLQNWLLPNVSTGAAIKAKHTRSERASFKRDQLCPSLHSSFWPFHYLEPRDISWFRFASSCTTWSHYLAV